jgi:hypothetical protein
MRVRDACRPAFRDAEGTSRIRSCRQSEETAMKSGYDNPHDWTKWEGSGAPRGAATFVGAAALGMAAMYMLDPDKGRRRRALVGDKAYALVSDTRHAVGAATRDVAHRIEGLRARARRVLTDTPVPDDLQLIERVRARMGRLVSHPHAIQVGANNGRVTLSGPILEHEVGRLLDAIRTVWGVCDVVDRLVVYDSPESISSLQGGELKTPSAYVHTHWSPALRTGAILGGAVVSAIGVRDRSIAGLVLAGAGVALLLRGATNEPLARLVGIEHAGEHEQALPVPEAADAPGASTMTNQAA